MGASLPSLHSGSTRGTTAAIVSRSQEYVAMEGGRCCADTNTADVLLITCDYSGRWTCTTCRSSNNMQNKSLLHVITGYKNNVGFPSDS